MQKRLLIIGGAGQLGGALADKFRTNDWEIFTPTRAELDIEESEEMITKKVGDFRPDLIINTAWLQTADCQKDPARAYHINALGAYVTARAAQKIGATSIYISTDYVFDGSREEGFSESDCPNPLNIYGASKLAGEQLTRIANPKHYIVRTSGLFGNHAKPLGNFVLKMKARANVNEKTTVVDDQFIAPSYAEDIAPIIRQIALREVPFGIYHATNNGRASWYDIAKIIFDTEGKSELLTAVKTTPDASGIVRPLHNALRSTLLNNLDFSTPPSWDDALKRYLALTSPRQ